MIKRYFFKYVVFRIFKIEIMFINLLRDLLLVELVYSF